MVLILFVLALPLSAGAHRAATGRPAPDDSISIPNLSHGQMAVIATYRAAILDLAARQVPTDPILRRLEGFIHLQFFDCLWGLVPGSVEDESSPFNECAHAYLAATRALLLHMETMPGDRAPVRALVARIEREMLDNGAALVLCRYSEEPFNTAERITPRWRDVPFHPASLVTLGGAASLLAACVGAAIRWLAQSAPRTLPATAPKAPGASSQ